MDHGDDNRRTTDGRRPRYLLHAVNGSGPIWDSNGLPVDVGDLPLSDRLLVAIEDWREFFDEVDGELDAPELDEFVGQGFKIAHRMRSELKGRDVAFRHPGSGQVIEIDS